MRETTIYTYNPTGTAALFGILIAAVVAAILALFTWHPWYVAPPSTTTNNTTTIVQPTSAPANNPGSTTNVNQQTYPQQPQPAPQST